MKRTKTGYQYKNVSVDTGGTISPRCAQALAMAATGLPYSEISKEMNIKHGSTKNTLCRLYYQLNVYNLTQAIHKAASTGLLKYLSAVFLVLFSVYTSDQPYARTARTARTTRPTARNRKRENPNQLTA